MPQKDTSKIRILTVDENPVLRQGLATMIGPEDDGVLVAEAKSGQQGIVPYDERRPDFTLMDLRLAEMSGIDAIHGIRARKVFWPASPRAQRCKGQHL